MDEFDIALARLKADNRSLEELHEACGLPKETLRDIKSGHVSSPRLDTLRKLAALYRDQRATQQPQARSTRRRTR